MIYLGSNIKKNDKVKQTISKSIVLQKNHQITKEDSRQSQKEQRNYTASKTQWTNGNKSENIKE